MDDSDCARTPNPFSPFTNTASRPRRLASTFKLLLAAVILMAITTAGQHALSRFRLAELLDGLSLGSAPQKIDRLEALGSYGDRGLPGIVSALADDQPEVAQAASSLITDLTLEWTTLPEEQQAQNRLALAESLNRVSQSISHTHDPKWQRLYRVAHSMTQQLIESPDGINQPAYPVLMRIVNRDTSSPEPDTDLTNDSEEKSRTLSDSPESWTGWPPQSDEESTAPSLYRRSVTTIATEKPSQILLSQATTDPRTDPTAKPEEPQLLRPNVRPASTPVSYTHLTLPTIQL